MSAAEKYITADVREDGRRAIVNAKQDARPEELAVEVLDLVLPGILARHEIETLGRVEAVLSRWNVDPKAIGLVQGMVDEAVSRDAE